MFLNKLVTRRHALQLSLATLAGIGACAKGKSTYWGQQAQGVDNWERNFKVVGEAPLKERAAAKGLIYGAAATFSQKSDPELAASLIQECGLLVPGFEFRWPRLNPRPDIFNFTPADSMVEWAKTHGMLLQGHPLIYKMPKWFKSQANRQNAKKIMVDYITKVVGRYSGQMHSWVVVNEAVNPKAGRSDGLANKIWLELLGPSYIELAFRAAAEADPQALLVYNDIGMYANTDTGEARRVAILKLLEHLKSKGTPIHALGIQGHIWISDWLTPRDISRRTRKFRTFVREVANLGLKIMVTELDVLDRDLPKEIEVRDYFVAQAYEEYLSAVLDEPAVIAVITWGLSDRYTWYKNPKFGKNREDGRKPRPLPLDDQMNRKLAWNAMVRAFDNAPSR